LGNGAHHDHALHPRIPDGRHHRVGDILGAQQTRDVAADSENGIVYDVLLSVGDVCRAGHLSALVGNARMNLAHPLAMIGLALVIGILFIAFALLTNLGDVRLYLCGGAALGLVAGAFNWWAKRLKKRLKLDAESQAKPLGI
jgi:hypothetical protein